MRHVCRWMLSLLLLFAGPLPAATPDAYLAQLQGRWDMQGSVRGKPAHYRTTGRWLHQDAWLHFAFTDVASPPQYQASIFFSYDAKAGDYVVHWLDQFGGAGARVVGTGERYGQTLVFSFPYAEGAFRDTLELAADGKSGTLLIEAQESDGTWSTFASYRLRRASRVGASDR